MLRKTNADKTVGFSKIPHDVLRVAREKLNEIHPNGDIHPDTVVTVLKSMIKPGSPIVSVPRKVTNPPYGTTFRIRLRDQPHPAFATMQQILGT